MPTPLSPQQLVLLQQETDYLDMGIPVEGSAVMNWDGTTILIYNSASVGYAVTDISDLSAATIQALQQQSSVNGMLYYLPQSIEETISSEATTAYNAAVSAGKAGADVVTAVAGAAGTAVAAAINPLVGSLMPVLVIVGVILAFVYFPKPKQ